MANLKVDFVRVRMAMVGVAFLATIVFACNQQNSEKHIVILSTNDIHGGIEAHGSKNGETGGLAFFAGAVKAIREGMNAKFGKQSGVLTVDAGDQFQGTLISNYTEGSLVFDAMNEVGYDYAITGNHDYDFGPHGWLVDDVKDQDASNPDKDPRGVIKDLAKKATFPILSANTYYRASLKDKNGKSVDVDGVGCKPSVATSEVDWTAALRPEFLKPYAIKDVAGVRVAVVGIDNVATPTTTTLDNVSDLCFRDELDTYAEIRKELKGKADVFVILMHDGNSDNEFGATDLVKKINALGPHSVDVVISGHTHFTYNLNIEGVPMIQSGSGGDHFGRIDLVYNSEKRALDPTKTVSLAGIRMDYTKCDPQAAGFCQVLPSGEVTYEGVKVVPDTAILQEIKQTRDVIAPMADRVLGHSDKVLSRDRIKESPLADALTDSFRTLSEAEISFLNTGGLRENIPSGNVTYEDLFKVIPFNNRGYVIGPMTVQKIVALLNRSIQTCGSYGALMQSGLKVTYTRNCAKGGEDAHAQLIHVETVAGEVLVDSGVIVSSETARVFKVATLDFLASGGAGYDDFAGTPLVKDLGILREVLTDSLVTNPGHWTGESDGRWIEQQP
jgi:5'-nucleotidase